MTDFSFVHHISIFLGFKRFESNWRTVFPPIKSKLLCKDLWFKNFLAGFFIFLEGSSHAVQDILHKVRCITFILKKGKVQYSGSRVIWLYVADVLSNDPAALELNFFFDYYEMFCNALHLVSGVSPVVGNTQVTQVNIYQDF